MTVIAAFLGCLAFATDKKQDDGKAKADFPYSKSWYVGIGGSHNDTFKHSGNRDLDTTKTDWDNILAVHDNDIGFNGFVGYRFNKYFALEGIYDYIGKVKLKQVRTGGSDYDTSHVESKNQQAALVGMVMAPVVEGLDLFVKAGIAWYYDKVTEHGTNYIFATSNGHMKTSGIGLRYGLGLQYTFPVNIGVRLDYTALKTGRERHVIIPDILSLNVFYIF